MLQQLPCHESRSMLFMMAHHQLLEFKVMADAQATDSDISPLKSSLRLEVVPCPLAMSNATILHDTTTAVAWLVVPKDYHHTVFESLHKLSHPNIRAMQCLLTT